MPAPATGIRCWTLDKPTSITARARAMAAWEALSRLAQPVGELPRRDDLDGELSRINGKQVEVPADDRLGPTGLGERDKVVVAGITTHSPVRARRIDKQDRLRRQVRHEPRCLISRD